MTMKRITAELKLYAEGFFNSYAQIMFSQSKVFAVILILVSFFNFGAGICGVIALIVSQLGAGVLNYNKFLIRDGKLTYNSLLVGIVIGLFYELNYSLVFLVVLASLLTLFLSVVLNKSFSKRALPIMSIPFLLVVWMIFLGIDHFSVLNIEVKKQFLLISYFPEVFQWVDDLVSKLPFADFLHIYFRSLGAIMFQYNDFAGIIIMIGILYYSRISFVASLYGFTVGYMFFKFLHGDFTQLIYSYIGFNFIIVAIGLGGFYIIANKRTFLLILFTVPIIAFLISALNSIFIVFHLPLYSLPFNLIIVIILIALFQRTKYTGLTVVQYQEYSPEKNHYKYVNTNQRYKNNTYIDIYMPFYGEWHISQGHNDKITHKGEWQHAFDFDIIDEYGKTYNDLGIDVKNYYCYDLPVIAPAGGWVVKIIDGIEDNMIGEINLEQNWGNSIVIKHSEFLYTKLSHLKKGSFKVYEGEYVERGRLLATCGSSGRSPEPHLHFQIQATPYVGSRTISYPLSHFLTKQIDDYKINFYQIPKKNQKVLNITPNKIIKNAFLFIPGKLIEWEINSNNKIKTQKWEVFVDIYNKTYIYCHSTKSYAYFYNNGTVFYFTDFFGNKNSALFAFYTGAYKVLLGYYRGISIEEPLLSYNHISPFIHFFHDFTAPFFHYLKAIYNFEFTKVDYEQAPELIEFTGNCKIKFFNKTLQNNKYLFSVDNNGIKEFSYTKNNKKISVKCVN